MQNGGWQLSEQDTAFQNCAKSTWSWDKCYTPIEPRERELGRSRFDRFSTYSVSAKITLRVRGQRPANTKVTNKHGGCRYCACSGWRHKHVRACAWPTDEQTTSGYFIHHQVSCQYRLIGSLDVQTNATLSNTLGGYFIKGFQMKNNHLKVSLAIFFFWLGG